MTWSFYNVSESCQILTTLGEYESFSPLKTDDKSLKTLLENDYFWWNPEKTCLSNIPLSQIWFSSQISWIFRWFPKRQYFRNFPTILSSTFHQKYNSNQIICRPFVGNFQENSPWNIPRKFAFVRPLESCQEIVWWSLWEISNACAPLKTVLENLFRRFFLSDY